METETKKNSKQQIITTIVVIAVFLTLALAVAKPLLGTVSSPEDFRDWVASKGIPGIFAFAALNILQVIFAVIPGGPFSIAAGYAFGTWRGILICDLAVTFGSCMVFLLVKKFGTRFTKYLISIDKLEKAKFLQSEKRLSAVLLLIFLIPGSPKDVITYAVGFTKLPLKHWIWINLIGRLPGIVLSVISGNALGCRDYKIVVIIWSVILVLYGIGILIYRKKFGTKN